MKQTIYSLTLFATLLLAADAACASNLLPTDSDDYYALNGGSDIAMPPVNKNASIDVGGNVDSNLNYNCTGFNPALSVSNTINDIGSSMEGLEGSVISSATSAVGSLPMYLLEKTDPKLYNLIENAMTGAEDTFNLSMKDCQQSLSDIKKGKSPYEDWFSVSDSNGWMQHAKAVSEGQKIDINDAEKNVTKTGDNAGVQWVHDGPSGGTVGSQVPIKVISDVAMAGYNILIDPKRALDDNDAPNKEAYPELTTFWPKPSDAGDFASLVLGDVKISSSKKASDQDTTAGVGLVPILTSCPASSAKNKTCVKTITDKLAKIVASDNVPSPDDLEQVSANGVAVTEDVINALRSKNSTEQSLYIARIGEDVAMQNLIDEALLLRRMLIAGSQAQQVQSLQPALNTVNTTIVQLNKDIENLLFEHNIRKEMTSSALKTLLIQQTNENAMSSKQESTRVPSSPTVAGALYEPNNHNNPQ
ncbi:MAG: integrating conjugative element protein [Gammaproteobacteria bacterium]|nr:integrating conjugative element protein [Gammaproteobacteria bacterium]